MERFKVSKLEIGNVHCRPPRLCCTCRSVKVTAFIRHFLLFYSIRLVAFELTRETISALPCLFGSIVELFRMDSDNVRFFFISSLSWTLPIGFVRRRQICRYVRVNDFVVFLFEKIFLGFYWLTIETDYNDSQKKVYNRYLCIYCYMCIYYYYLLYMSMEIFVLNIFSVLNTRRNKCII